MEIIKQEIDGEKIKIEIGIVVKLNYLSKINHILLKL